MFLFNYEVLLINYINYTPQVNTYYLFITFGACMTNLLFRRHQKIGSTMQCPFCGYTS